MKSMKKIVFLLAIIFFSFSFFKNAFASGIGIQGPNITPSSIKANQANTISHSFTLTGTQQDAKNVSCAGTTGDVYWELQVGRAGSAWKQVANAVVPSANFPLQNPITGSFQFTPGNGDTSESFQVVLYCGWDPDLGAGKQFSASAAATIAVTGQTQGQFGINFGITQPSQRTVTPGQTIPMFFALSVNGNQADIQNRCGQVSFIKWLVTMYPATQNDNFSDSNLINSGTVDTVKFGSGNTFTLDFQKNVTVLNQDFVIKARAICSGSTILTTSSGVSFNAGGAGTGGTGSGTGGGAPGQTQTYSFNIPNPLKGGASDLTSLVKIIAQWIFNLAIPIAVAMIVYAGILFLTSAGDTSKVTKAKEVLTYAVVGLAIILIGSGFVTLIQSILELGGTGTTQNPGSGLPVEPQLPTLGGAIGNKCSTDRNCLIGLACKNAICQRPTGNLVGEPCVAGASCDVGLACDSTVENKQVIDGQTLGTCFETSAGGGRIGDICQNDKDCISGLKCNQICQRKGGNLVDETCLKTSNPSNCKSTACNTVGTATEGICINYSGN